MDIDLSSSADENREFVLRHLMTNELLFCQRDSGADEFTFSVLLASQTNQLKTKHNLLLGKKIMLIENCRSLLYEQLTYRGGRVECFADMQEAVEYLDLSELEDRPDVIVLNAGINGQLLDEQHTRTSVISLFDAARNDPVVFVKPSLELEPSRSTLELPASYRITRLVNGLAKLLGQKPPFLGDCDPSQVSMPSLSPAKPSILKNCLNSDENLGSDSEFVLNADVNITDFEVNTAALKDLIKDCSKTACIDMIDIFVDESKQSMLKIHLACRQEDAVLIAMESHAIKSAARTFGCDSLHDLVSQLNIEARESNIDKCHYLVTKLEHVFEKSRDQLGQFKSNLKLESKHSDEKLTAC